MQKIRVYVGNSLRRRNTFRVITEVTFSGIRQKHPDKDWFQVAGLIHDIGKVMALWGEPQWCVVGDTFPVGCAPVRSIVFDAQFFEGNY